VIEDRRPDAEARRCLATHMRRSDRNARPARGLAHSGAHAALIFLNPGLGFAGPIVPRDLGNIDTQIDGEQTVQFSRNPRIEVVPGGSDAPI
jgi:hypothetical protein